MDASSKKDRDGVMGEVRKTNNHGVKSVAANSAEESAEANALKVIDTAIKSLEGGDDGAHWEPDVIEAARYIFQDNKAQFQRKRSELKKASNNAQITEWTKEVKGGGNEVEDTTKSGEIVELVQGCSTLFHDPHGECFVSFEQGDHFETWGIASKGFSNWLSYKAYRELGFGVGNLTPYLAPFNLALFFTWQLSDYDTNDFWITWGVRF